MRDRTATLSWELILILISSLRVKVFEQQEGRVPARALHGLSWLEVPLDTRNTISDGGSKLKHWLV
jgi:hypothetical protein